MKTLITVVTATLLSAAAMAGDHPAKTVAFESLDKNADSQISKTEASADKMVSDAFVAIDTNGDGYVSKAEYVARAKS